MPDGISLRGKDLGKMRKSDIRDDNGNNLNEQKWKTDGVSFTIIGGADGPTSIFLAGKLGGNDAKEQSEEEAEAQTKEQMEEQTEMKAEVITAKQAKEIMEQNTECVILDVREQSEYEEGHIAGAILIPYTEMENKAEEELPDKDQLILVYCRSGRRSAIAAASAIS